MSSPCYEKCNSKATYGAPTRRSMTLCAHFLSTFSVVGPTWLVPPPALIQRVRRAQGSPTAVGFHLLLCTNDFRI
jgi:hypothetical protein